MFLSNIVYVLFCSVLFFSVLKVTLGVQLNVRVYVSVGGGIWPVRACAFVLMLI